MGVGANSQKRREEKQLHFRNFQHFARVVPKGRKQAATAIYAALHLLVFKLLGRGSGMTKNPKNKEV